MKQNFVTSNDPRGRDATDLFRRCYDRAQLVDGSAQYFNDNPETTRMLLEVIQECSVPSFRKFELLVDLGIVEIDKDYVHSNCLDSFGLRNRNKFSEYNDAITDLNFPNPSRILKPGDKLWVRVFNQISNRTTTSDERMAFLATLGAIHTGAQGASIVWEQKRAHLPKGLFYSSFDEKDHLWQDHDGNHGIPRIDAYQDSIYEFHLGYYENDAWFKGDCMFCFNELPS